MPLLVPRPLRASWESSQTLPGNWESCYCFHCKAKSKTLSSSDLKRFLDFASTRVIKRFVLSILPSHLWDHAIVIAVLSKLKLLKLLGIRNPPACSFEMGYLEDPSGWVFLCRWFFQCTIIYDGMMGRVFWGIKCILLHKKQESSRVWSMLTVLSQLVS